MSDNTPSIGEVQRWRIVRAAYELCVTQGFSKLTINGIAKQAGITRSLIYHYFSDKDAVAEAVINYAVEEHVVKSMHEWNEARVSQDLYTALLTLITLERKMFSESKLFRDELKGYTNGQIYVQFSDLLAEHVSKYICNTITKDFHDVYPPTVKYVPETLQLFTAGLTNLVRRRPDIPDEVILDILITSFHLEPYINEKFPPNTPESVEGTESAELIEM